MDFIYLFDVVEFDKNGDVCETKRYDKNVARANYLYLISKYNQLLLKEKNEKVPDFFKSDLQTVMTKAKEGKNFQNCVEEVVKHCTPKVQEIAGKSKNDKELILGLNSASAYIDKSFASDFREIDNVKHFEYVLTFVAGQLFERTVKNMLKDFETDKKVKSGVYKDIIGYNSLVTTASRAKDKNFVIKDSLKFC